MPGSSPEEKEVESKVSETTNETATTDVKDTPAESSPAEKPGEKGDMLSAVKAALKPQEKSPTSEDQGSKSEEAEEEAAEKEGAKTEGDADDITEEELAQLQKLKPKTAKRITTLLEQKGQLTQELDELRPQAEQFRQIVDFVREAGLAKDEINNGFDVMRNLKRDPARAYEQIKPIYEQLQRMFGDVLPDDLQQEVNLGRITEAYARELARTRSTAAVNERRAREVEQRRQEEQDQTAFENQRQQAASSVTEWEKSKASKDPDWKLKQSRVTELIELELHRKQKANPNYFPTPQQAVAMAEDALKKVEDEFKRIKPKPKAITPVTDVASTRSAPKPTSAVEAAKLGLARMSAAG